jgi:hypothetical protein
VGNDERASGCVIACGTSAVRDQDLPHERDRIVRKICVPFPEEGGYILRPELLTEWADLAAAISKTEPRFLAQSSFPKRYAGWIESCLKVAEDELSSEPKLDDPSDMREEASRLIEIANSLRTLAALAPEYAPQATDVASRLVQKSYALEERANEEEGPEPDYDDARDSLGDEFDIRLIFSDL